MCHSRFISCRQSLCLQCLFGYLHFQVYLVLVKYTGWSVYVHAPRDLDRMEKSKWAGGKFSSAHMVCCFVVDRIWQVQLSALINLFLMHLYTRSMWSLLPHTWTRVRLSELYVPGLVRVGWCALRENEQVQRIQCVWESDTEKTTRRLLSSDIVERESDQGSRDTAL